MQHVNTPALHERLAVLIEEAVEVAAAANALQLNPAVTSQAALEQEVADLLVAVQLIEAAGDLQVPERPDPATDRRQSQLLDDLHDAALDIAHDCCKALRHGLGAPHPNDCSINTDRIAGHLRSVIDAVHDAIATGLLSRSHIADAAARKRYSLHQHIHQPQPHLNGTAAPPLQLPDSVITRPHNPDAPPRRFRISLILPHYYAQDHTVTALTPEAAALQATRHCDPDRWLSTEDGDVAVAAITSSADDGSDLTHHDVPPRLSTRYAALRSQR